MNFKWITLLAVVVSSSAMAAPQNLSKCSLVATPLQGPASAIQTVPFSRPVTNHVGAIERQATVGSTTVTLGQGGNQKYITVLDSAKQVYFAAAYEAGSMYATPETTYQVSCQ